MLLDSIITYVMAKKGETIFSIVVSLFTDFLSVTMDNGKQRRKMCKFKNQLGHWAETFQRKNDGSILTKGVYIRYLKNYRIIEKVYQYALEPDLSAIQEDAYIAGLAEHCGVMLNSEEIIVSPTDESVLKEFYTGLLEQVKNFLKTTAGMEARELLYILNQILLGNKECMKILCEMDKANQNSYQYMENRLEEVLRLLKENGPVIDDEWFLKQNKEAILNMGKRYLPDLNITLDIQENFDIVAANKQFFNRLCEEAEELLISIYDLRGKDDFLYEQREKMIETLQEMTTFAEFAEKQVQLIELAEEIRKYASEEYEKRIEEKRKERQKAGQLENYLSQMEINQYRRIWVKAERYSRFVGQGKMNLVQTPFLILYGEGGIGKSHLIADTVVRRNHNSERSILLLGQDFPAGCIIWTRFTELLGYEQSMDAILQTINRIAEERKSRILIFIDAINEGGGREVWHDRLAFVVDKIAGYPWLGLVLSIRKDFMRSMIEPDVIERYNITQIEHYGFGRLTEEAIHKFFEYYGIDLNVMPYFPEEFSNPLFLRLFCEGYKNNSREQIIISTEQIYVNYIEEINRRLEVKYDYASQLNVVDVIIKEFTLRSYGKYQRNKLDKREAVELICSIAAKYQISTSIYDALISEGILASGIDYNNSEYVYITYERLADHIYAKSMVGDIIERKRTDEELLACVNKPGILEELACILPAQGVEVFERFPALEEDWRMADAFNASIVWRTDAGLEKLATYQFINNHVTAYDGLYEEFYENLIQVSTNAKHPYNANSLYDMLTQMTMAERDSEFMELFQSWNTREHALSRLVHWTYQVAGGKIRADEETIYLAAITLSWMLISTDNQMRDEVSIALCQLLRGHTAVMIRVLQKFQDIDDRYITERLFAVAFGISTFEKDGERRKELARYVYDQVFAKEEVIPDILIRDAAKQIICYTMSMEIDTYIDMEKVRGPYHSLFPKVPTDEAIEKYELDYKAEGFRDRDWAQNAIIRSMRIDDGTGGYGDFGRYVFQRYFEQWKNLDIRALMKIAIEDVFVRGYHVELHGEYDRDHRDSSRMAERKTERIGKKYQWQALYQLAAQVSDHFTRVNEATGEAEYKVGAYEPRLRDFDPTVNIIGSVCDWGKIPRISYHNFDYPTEEWMEMQDDLPSFAEMVNLNLMGENYLLLSGMHNWKEEKPLGVKEYDCPLKEMWFMIQAYIVREEEYDLCIQVLENANFWGRWMPEASDNYVIYNREYYWSYTHAYYEHEYYGGNEWKRIWNTEFEELKEIEFLIPNYNYMSTAEKEIIGLSYHNWKKPCKSLFQELHLHYQDENTVLYDPEGQVVCFDTCEAFGEDRGFYFSQKAMERFLKEHHYKMFWTVLGEKRVIGGEVGYGMDMPVPPEYSGLFYFDEEGELSGELKKFG